MKITLLVVGKKHDKNLLDAINDYQRRAAHYMPIEWIFIQAKHAASTTRNDIRKLESQKIVSQLQQNSWVCLLDEGGIAISTPQLAQKIEWCKNNSLQTIVFIIGGAYGVDESVIKRADFIWSLSPLVFPHQLVRLILIEQLYRAHTILAGEKYHHQ
jgi:23S rRNA (pseudouridine1915-N3)-methyltransferase